MHKHTDRSYSTRTIYPYTTGHHPRTYVYTWTQLASGRTYVFPSTNAHATRHWPHPAPYPCRRRGCRFRTAGCRRRPERPGPAGQSGRATTLYPLARRDQPAARGHGRVPTTDRSPSSGYQRGISAPSLHRPAARALETHPADTCFPSPPLSQPTRDRHITHADVDPAGPARRVHFDGSIMCPRPVYFERTGRRQALSA